MNKKSCLVLREMLQTIKEEPSYRHIVLGDVGGNLELVLGDGRVEMLDAGQRVDLRLDGRRHERREPPGHHLGPEGGVDDVECLQVFLVSAIEYGERKL